MLIFKTSNSTNVMALDQIKRVIVADFRPHPDNDANRVVRFRVELQNDAVFDQETVVDAKDIAKKDTEEDIARTAFKQVKQEVSRRAGELGKTARIVGRELTVQDLDTTVRKT